MALVFVSPQVVQLYVFFSTSRVRFVVEISEGEADARPTRQVGAVGRIMGFFNSSRG
jgi:hypothetical protein